jgi:superfamily II DNA or RNA helicase
MNSAVILHKCHSWRDVRFQLEALSTSEKGDCFEALSHYFLQLDPKYVTLLRRVWPLRRVPAGIRNYLNLPGPDEGIDLIAETKDGQFWSIQCKYIENENASIGRKYLSTFFDLSFNICKHITYCLVCTTADRFSHKFTLYGERLGFCAGDTWRSLDNQFFDRLHQLLDGKTAPLNPLVPRPHQRRVIHNGYTHFIRQKNSCGKLIMPCGSGKTLAAFWLAQELKARTILVAAPSLALIRQTIEVWAREFVAQNLKVQWIAVCSDESVGKIESDDVTLLTHDLGIKVSTDSEEIAGWLKKQENGNAVVFTTYQSGRAIADAARTASIVFDVGILDEAHKTVGRRENLFSHLLFDKNIRITKRIFMTATERRYLGQSDEIASMDDEDVYGGTFEFLSFKKALEAKPPILSDYKVVTIGVSREEIASLIQRNLFVRPDGDKWENDVEAEMLAGLVALRKAMRKHPIRHAVSFHSTIRRARIFKENMDTFTNVFPDYGPLSSFHVFGTMPTSVRSAEMDRFSASNHALITNARCLTEGVDVPNIDGILFADPKRSTVDIVQAVGRALRPSEGKKIGYVVIPVLLDAHRAENQTIQPNAFSNVLIVLRALGANDERIIDYFRGISQGRRPARGKEPFRFDIPEGLKIDAMGFINSIQLQLWSRLAKLSWRPFEEARAFVRRLEIRTFVEWRKYTKGDFPEKGACPPDIPAGPQDVYKDHGWISWGDWLGTSTVSHWLPEIRPFHEARTFARRLNLKSGTEWKAFCRGELTRKGMLPKDIPANPNECYRAKGWLSWGDWLGTGVIAPALRIYRPFQDARVFAHGLKLKGASDWRKFCNGKLPERGTLPTDIPATPARIYKNQGWINWGDWLGTGYVANYLRTYRSFEQAREFVHGLRITNYSEWYAYCRGDLPDRGTRPDDIPADPHNVYKNHGWLNWGDWLGTGSVAVYLRTYRSFEQAREFVHRLVLKNESEWRAYYRGQLPGKGVRPEDIPTNPNRVYKDTGWKGMGDWLGTGFIANRFRQCRPFRQARAFVRRLKLKSNSEWWAYCRGKLPGKGVRPDDIPTNPHRAYKDEGWISLGDWLGTGIVATRFRRHRPFRQAREFVRRLELKSVSEWRKFCAGQLPKKRKFPRDIPANPSQTYRDKGWVSWGDWVGRGTVASSRRQYRQFSHARAFVRLLGLQGQSEWRKFCAGQLPKKGKLPRDIPANPSQTYRDKGWVSWGDWLGTGTVATRYRHYRSFQEARAFVRRLKLRSGREWKQYCKGDLSKRRKLPRDIPSNPHRTYKNHWIGMRDWLGIATQTSSRRQYRHLGQVPWIVPRADFPPPG